MPERKFQLRGQDHIVKLLDQGASFISRDMIERDLKNIDMSLIHDLMAGKHLYIEPDIQKVRPAEIVPASFASDSAASPFRIHGEDLLAQGRVAALIVAGGQGSRLGIEAPKGVVGVSPIRSKSLFQLHAEKILASSLRYNKKIPLFIMTSRENDEETRDYFVKNSFFGLDHADVFFFMQGMLPSLTVEGDLILSRDGGLFMNPDGHGGTLTALQANGCLDIMKKRGIEEIFYFQVDNPLVFICDPLFIGLHNRNGAQMSSKVIRKRDFNEKVGVIAEVEGKTRLIEYSDMDDYMRYAKDEKGEILYWTGNPAIHMIRRDFVEKLTNTSIRLPFHKAVKLIPSLDRDGKSVEIQGIKFETFIFDALPLAEKSITMEVIREHEFAPVKNRTGEDSLDSSRKMQSNLHKNWLRELGIKVDDTCLVEISPLTAIEKDDLKLQIESLPRNIVKDIYIGQ